MRDGNLYISKSGVRFSSLCVLYTSTQLLHSGLIIGFPETSTLSKNCEAKYDMFCPELLPNSQNGLENDARTFLVRKQDFRCCRYFMFVNENKETVPAHSRLKGHCKTVDYDPVILTKFHSCDVWHKILKGL